MIVGREENSEVFRLTALTSSYLVTAQNPGPSGSACQWTGSLFRSHAYWSMGWPSA